MQSESLVQLSASAVDVEPPVELAPPLDAEPLEPPVAPPDDEVDFLVSFSCNQVQARSFPWPHPYTGMTASTVSDLTQIVKKLWPGG